MQPACRIVLSTCFLISAYAFGETSAQVDVNLSPAGSFRGETNAVKGYAYKTSDGVAAENVAVDLRTLKTGVSLRDKHTKDHLEVEKFPEAKLIKAKGKDGKGEALVEIHGVKRSVAGTYKIAGDRLQAQFPILLSDVKIDKIRYMGVGVKDEVVVNVDLPIKAAPAGGNK